MATVLILPVAFTAACPPPPSPHRTLSSTSQGKHYLASVAYPRPFTKAEQYSRLLYVTQTFILSLTAAHIPFPSTVILFPAKSSLLETLSVNPNTKKVFTVCLSLS